MARHKATMIVDLNEYIGKHQLQGLGIGHDNKIYILSTEEDFSRREGNFALVKSREAHDYTVTIINEKLEISQVVIPNQRFIYTRVQPLHDNELLLVSARAKFRSRHDFDRNAKVFSYDGYLLREFTLGEGITTSNYHIWIGHFDQGVYWNYEWQDAGATDVPSDVNGLFEWDHDGNNLWGYPVQSGTSNIWDVYGLTVDDDDVVWAYYYSYTNRLVAVKDGTILKHWRVPFASSQIAVWKEHTAFLTGSTIDLWLCEPDRPMRKVSKHKLRPTPHFLSTRGHRIIYYTDDKIYELSISDLL
ncbi:MAG: hypothetical protein AAF846_07650 [Chloroflexota bacterium]